jgi:hypothetical protein
VRNSKVRSALLTCCDQFCFALRQSALADCLQHICNFNVPEFIIDQQLRIRTKVHSSKNKNGYCDISVIASCQPIDIKKLKKSSYSLDMIDNLPRVLNYRP